jgi:hypothetical protein
MYPRTMASILCVLVNAAHTALYCLRINAANKIFCWRINAANDILLFAHECHNNILLFAHECRKHSVVCTWMPQTFYCLHMNATNILMSALECCTRCTLIVCARRRQWSGCKQVWRARLSSEWPCPQVCCPLLDAHKSAAANSQVVDTDSCTTSAVNFKQCHEMGGVASFLRSSGSGQTHW